MKRRFYCHRKFVSRCCLLALSTLLSASMAQGGLVITLDDQGGTVPTGTTGTGSLGSVMRDAADVWELAFNDDSFDHTLNIEFFWAPFSGGTLAAHNLLGQGGSPNRETAARIRFDNDGSSNYFLDGTLDPTNPIGAGNTEFSSYTESTQDFGGGAINKERRFLSATGAAAGQFDLFSVALHEIGHALGLSSANTSYQDESWPDNDIDVITGMFSGSQLPTNNGNTPETGSTSNAHLDISTTLMYPFISAGRRQLPSAVDILANATLSQFSSPNLDLSSVPEPSSILMCGIVFGLTLSRRRRFAV